MMIQPNAGASGTSPGGGRQIVVGVVVLLVVLLAAGILPRVARARRVDAEVDQARARPSVTVAPVVAGERDVVLSLPASLSGLHEVGLYARSNGYLSRFDADIGSRVRAGQLLAVIETPELDQELSVARATVEQVQATNALTRTTLDRWRSMADAGVATRQEFDERQAAFNVSTANLNAARANLERLLALKTFAKVVAPFSGVVTSRNVDVGALVSPLVAVGARPLFTLAQVDTLRAITFVPQDAAPGIRIGQDAEIFVQELGDSYTGRVTRTAQAIDPSTRTLQTIIEVSNAAGHLLPGMYAQVKLTSRRAQPPLRVPSNALIVRGDGPQVGVVRDGVVHIAKLTLGRDFGTQIEALSGVAEGDQLVVNPDDDVAEGAEVRVITPKAPDSSAGAANAPAPSGARSQRTTKGNFGRTSP